MYMFPGLPEVNLLMFRSWLMRIISKSLTDILYIKYNHIINTYIYINFFATLYYIINLLYNTSLLYGDIVKKSPNDMMSGTIVNVNAKVDIKHNISNQIIHNVDTRHITYCWKFRE